MDTKPFMIKKLNPRVLAAAAAFALGVPTLLAQTPPPAQELPTAQNQAQNQAPGQRTDGQIEMDVVQALDNSAALKNDLITAATIQGQVTLSGTVASDADRQLAESISSKVPGVTKVNNNLKVGNPANDPNAQTDLNDNNAPPIGNDQADGAPSPSYGPPEGQ